MRARWILVGTAYALLFTAPSARAYWTETWHWAPGPVVLYLQQGSSPGTLLDGSADWDSVTEDALATWNSVLNGVSLQAVRDQTVPAGMPSDANNVVWGDDVYGDPFGDGVAAITLSLYTIPDNLLVESDVIFNQKMNWNSYRGNLRYMPGGDPVNDLRRIALHEFGHFIGLGHPDDHDQSVLAMMNRRIGDVDTLLQDDIDGAAAIYGVPPPIDTVQPASHRTH